MHHIERSAPLFISINTLLNLPSILLSFTSYRGRRLLSFPVSTVAKRSSVGPLVEVGVWSPYVFANQDAG